jgi:hypothetical protein
LRSNPSNEGKKKKKEFKESCVLVAHGCNPSYSGGRDQKGYGLKPALGNSFRDPILKNYLTTKGLVEWLRW